MRSVFRRLKRVSHHDKRRLTRRAIVKWDRHIAALPHLKSGLRPVGRYVEYQISLLSGTKVLTQAVDVDDGG